MESCKGPKDLGEYEHFCTEQDVEVRMAVCSRVVASSRRIVGYE